MYVHVCMYVCIYTYICMCVCMYVCVCVKLKDRKRSLSGKNDHNALWHYRNSDNANSRVVAVFKQPQRVVTCEDMP